MLIHSMINPTSPPALYVSSFGWAFKTSLVAQTVKCLYNAGDPGSSPGLGRSPGEGNGNPLQYYCLENPVDRGAWQAAVYGVAKSRTQPIDLTSLHFILTKCDNF